MKRIRGKRTKPPPQRHLKGVPETIGIFYKERRTIQRALRLLAIQKGHNSIGKVIREATEKYLKEENVPEEWLTEKTSDNG